MKRRIIRADAYNWAIQEWQEGGDIVERGRFAGNVKQSKWKNPEKFYRTLEDASKAMFDEIVSDNWNISGKNLTVMIAEAHRQVANHVREILSNMEDSTLCGILQERGYIVKPNSKNSVDSTSNV